MSLRRKAIKGVGWSALQNIFVRFSSFLVLLVLARLLNPADFGLVALAGVAIHFLEIFINGGFAAAIVQRDKLEPQHLNTAFWVNIGVAITLMALLIPSVGTIANAFDQPDLEPIILWLSLGLLFNSLSQVQMAILKRNLRFRALAIRSAVAEPVAGALAVALALNGFGVWSLVYRELVAAFIKLVLLWRASDWRPGFEVSRRHFKDLFGFGASMLGSSIVRFFGKRSIVVLIGYFLSANALGYYTVANRIVRMLTQFFGGTISSVAWPVFSRLQNQPDKLRNAYYKATSLISLAAWPIFLGLIVTANDLVPVVFGEKWMSSIPILQIVCLLGLLRTLFSFNGSVIVGLGKPQWRLALDTVIGIASILSFFIVMQWGIVAVAAAYTAVWYLFAPIYIWMVYLLIDINLSTYFRLYLVPMAATGAMLAVVLGFKFLVAGGERLSIYQLVLVIAMGGVTYILAVRLLSPHIVNQVKGLLREALPVSRLRKG